ncbi:MAG: hypothetical protein KC535_03765 [Nanoarchaeota archaeon]|nr:hypothetical protein [Nanoarchaeota archaeon]
MDDTRYRGQLISLRNHFLKSTLQDAAILPISREEIIPLTLEKFQTYLQKKTITAARSGSEKKTDHLFEVQDRFIQSYFRPLGRDILEKIDYDQRLIHQETFYYNTQIVLKYIRSGKSSDLVETAAEKISKNTSALLFPTDIYESRITYIFKSLGEVAKTINQSPFMQVATIDQKESFLEAVIAYYKEFEKADELHNQMDFSIKQRFSQYTLQLAKNIAHNQEEEQLSRMYHQFKNHIFLKDISLN